MLAASCPRRQLREPYRVNGNKALALDVPSFLPAIGMISQVSSLVFCLLTWELCLSCALHKLAVAMTQLISMTLTETTVSLYLTYQQEN